MARRTSRRSKTTRPTQAPDPLSRTRSDLRATAKAQQELEGERLRRETARTGEQLALGDLIAAAASGTEIEAGAELEARLAQLQGDLLAASLNDRGGPRSGRLSGADVRDGLERARELVARAQRLQDDVRAERMVWVHRAVRMGIPAVEIAQLCGVERNTAQVWQREIRAGRRPR